MPQTRAAAPATIGDENDVPNASVDQVPCADASGSRRWAPGATMSSFAPLAPALSSRPTASTWFALAGHSMAEPFPAAATTSAPDLISLSSAADAWADGALGNVSETFTTSSCDVVLATPAR